MTARRAFTLIEMMIVISIIVILMTLLIPAMSAAIRAVKTNATETRVAMLDRAVKEYAKAFGAPPLDSSPDRNMNKTNDDSYYAYVYPDGREANYIFNSGQWLDQPFGGKFLAYFLMGPNGSGWKRPVTTVSSHVTNYRNKGLSQEWDVPEGLTEFLENSRVSQGCSSSYPFPVFVDAFGLEGSNGGVIGYMRANVHEGGSSRWKIHNGPFWPALYNDCRSHPSYPGDDAYRETGERIFSQCEHDFALLSPGADQKYGYRVTSMKHNGQWRKGNWSNLKLGLCDDIGNFTLRAGEVPDNN